MRVFAWVVLFDKACCFLSRFLCILNKDSYFPDIRCYNDGLRQLSDLIICFALQFSVHFKGQSLRTNQIERLPAALCGKARKSQRHMTRAFFFFLNFFYFLFWVFFFVNGYSFKVLIQG